MDAPDTFRRIFLLWAAVLFVATTGRAAAGLQVDNTQPFLTGATQSQNISVTSSDSSTVLNFDVGNPVNTNNPPPGLPPWLKATVIGCNNNNDCSTPATVSLSLINDLGQWGAGPFYATVGIGPHNSAPTITITVTFYPGAAGVPGALVVTPTPLDPVYTASMGYLNTTPGVLLPTQPVQVNGTQSFSVSGTALSGGSWLVLSAGGTSGTQISNVPASQILTISLNANAVSNLATALYQGVVVITGADGVSTATINVSLSINGGNGSPVTVTPSQLTFAYSNGASQVAIPLETVLITTPQGSNFTATTDTPGWIVLPAQATGAVPGSLAVRINPPSTPKTYSGNVFITVGTVTQKIPVQLLVSTTPVLWADTANGGGTVLFSSQGSVITPASANVSVVASDGSSPALSVLASPSWVNVALNGNTLAITPNISGTAPALLSDTVVVGATGLVNSPLSIPVVLVANGGSTTGALTFNPSSLAFQALQGGTPPDAQELTISAPTTTGFNVSSSTNNGVGWLQVSPTFGATNTSLTVTVDPTLVTPRTTPYDGSIIVTASGGSQPQVVPVTLTVSPATGGNVTVDNNAVNLTGQVGTTKQLAMVTVSNAVSGGAPVLYNVTSTASAMWLKATPVQAATQSIVTITADPTGLAANTYTGQVTISPSGGTPVTVNVTFTVQPLPVISVSRTSFTFTYLPGGQAPGTQTVQISGGSFTAAVASGGDWLSVSPSSGAAGANLTISVNPAGQSSGAHSGVITVTGANNTVSLTVTLNVSLPLPTVTSVVNGASFQAGAISGGEVITAFGTQLGPTTPATAQIDSTGKLATTLGGVQVLVNGFAAPMIYASATQVTAVVPYQVAGYQQATVQVTYLNQRSNATNLSVATTAPGIFALNSQGTGAGARNADFSPNGPANPVAKGSYVVFFLTGEGPLNPAGVTGKINPATGSAAIAALPVGVLINNQPANWNYAGGIPGVVEGILQLNVQIPQNVPSGDLPVLVTIGGHASQAGVTVSVQ